MIEEDSKQLISFPSISCFRNTSQPIMTSLRAKQSLTFACWTRFFDIRRLRLIQNALWLNQITLNCSRDWTTETTLSTRSIVAVSVCTKVLCSHAPKQSDFRWKISFKKQLLLFFKNHKTLSRTYFCLDLGDGCIHVFLAVLQHFNNGILCVRWLGERRDEALKDWRRLNDSSSVNKLS